jgi:hypothetical protein
LSYDNYYFNDDVDDEEHGHNYLFIMFFLASNVHFNDGGC